MTSVPATRPHPSIVIPAKAGIAPTPSTTKGRKSGKAARNHSPVPSTVIPAKAGNTVMPAKAGIHAFPATSRTPT